MSDPLYTAVAYVSGDCFAVSNAAGDTFVGEFVVGLRVWADCQADGIRLGTVTAAGHDAGAGRTLVTVAVDAGAVLTPNLAAVRHGNDIPESLCNHAGNHAIGGRDPLPPASTALAGLVRLASAAATQAGADTEKAVTPAGLAAAAKGLVSANTTIHVATTGSDVTGTGAASAPFASIAKALASIAGKLIASGVIVTIQVADGTYSLGSTITIDHPDADKIQILGNTSVEQLVAIAAIDSAAKTITLAGDYTANILAGDIVGLAGSSTSGLNGAYAVSGVVYSSGYTTVACAAETFSSSAVEGGCLIIFSWGRCIIESALFYNFIFQKPLNHMSGFRLKSSYRGSGMALFCQSNVNFVSKMIIDGWLYGLNATSVKIVIQDIVLKSCTLGIMATYDGTVQIATSGRYLLDSCSTALYCSASSLVALSNSVRVFRNNAVDYSPSPVGTVGNDNSIIVAV